MTRLSQIEARLLTLSGPEFQELCDSYLNLRNPLYKLFSRTGAQTGKQKTTTGTPDSFLLLPDDTYLFVEVTTQQEGLVEKFNRDISKCLDENKTHIPITKIREIILCFNSKLSSAETEEIILLAASLGYNSLVFLSISELAIQIHLNYPNLAKEYLGFELDSGQIITIDRFKEVYNNNAKTLATPIDNPFLHRLEELEILIDKLTRDDLIVLSGPPGVGKTKLAIEGISKFLLKNIEYNGYFFLNKNYHIFPDMAQYFGNHSKNILFVDDANRISRLLEIVDFKKGGKTGELKIVITVRDYAVDQLKKLIPDIRPIEVPSLSQDAVIDIIKGQPFNIVNEAFQDVILRISGSNPRLALMAARIALKEQKLSALHNVYDLYEEYFKTFIQDNELLEDKTIQKVLGLISFFNVLPYSKDYLISPLLERFEIQNEDFFAAIDKLDQLELVEIQKHDVTISDQTLGTFFFFKVFFKLDLLPLATIFEHYYESHNSRIKDTIIPSVNTFGFTIVREKIHPILIKHLTDIRGDEQKVQKFLELFWFYLENEVFDFVYKEIKRPYIGQKKDHDIWNELTGTESPDPHLKLLKNFLVKNDNLKTALELSIDYVVTHPWSYKELIKIFKEAFSFDFQDEHEGFFCQNTLYDFILFKIEESPIKQDIFFSISNGLLKFQFQQSHSMRGHKFSIYRYALKANQLIKNFRKRIWESVDLLSRSRHMDCAKLINKYSEGNIDVDKTIINYDLIFLIDIINRKLDPLSFYHCYAVQNLLLWLKRIEIDNVEFQALKTKFTNEKYQVFRKLDFNQFKDKSEFEFEDYNEYSKLKEEEIRSSFEFHSLSEFGNFVDTYFHIVDSFKEKDMYQLRGSFDIVMDENLAKNPLRTLMFFKKVIHDLRFNFFFPVGSIRRMASLSLDNRKAFWKSIRRLNFLQSIFDRQGKRISYLEKWRLEYLLKTPDGYVTKSEVNALLREIKNLKHQNMIWLEDLIKFKMIEPKIFSQVLTVVLKRNAKSKTKITFDHSVFEKCYLEINDTDLLKRSYLQQYAIQSLFDYNGESLSIILKRDPEFLIEFLQSVIKNPELSFREVRSLSVAWELNNSSLISRALVLIMELGSFESESILDSFFMSLPGVETQAKADKFILDFIFDHNKSPRYIEYIFLVINKYRSNLFNEAFYHYLTYNSSAEDFARVSWINDGEYIHRGDANIGEINSSKWKRVLHLVESAGIGIHGTPIRSWVNKQIDEEQRRADALNRMRMKGD